MSQTNTAVEPSSALAEPPIPLIFTDSAAAMVLLLTGVGIWLPRFTTSSFELF